MNKAISTSVLSVSAVLLLQGCTVFRTLGLIDRKPRVEQAMAPAGPPAAEAQVASFTRAGREQLDQGNYGRALESFQQALAQGEAPAAPLNGLGVAYAGIGRIDLAAQYFRMAMAAEPANDHYAANLSLLLKSHDLADALPRQALAPTVAPAAAPVTAAAEAPRGRLVQVSPREFRIRTAPVDRSDGARVARLEQNFRPLVRIEIMKREKPAAPAAPAADVPAAPVGAPAGAGH